MMILVQFFTKTGITWVPMDQIAKFLCLNISNEDWLNNDFAVDVHVFAAKILIRFHFYFSPNSQININVLAAIFVDEFGV